MKTFKPNLKTLVLASFLAIAILSAPLVSLADNDKNKKENGNGNKHKTEQHEKSKKSKKKSFDDYHPRWNRLFGWFMAQKYRDTSDLKKPVISDVSINSIGAKKATVNWETDVPANSLVWIDTDSSIDTSETPDFTHRYDWTKSHKINLTGLDPETKYYVIVGSTNNGTNNRVLSSEISFTTTKTDTDEDEVKPVIASRDNITIAATSSAGAVVNYTSPNVTDNIDSTTTATCLPASGSIFPIGVTTVYCNHTDSNGNKATQKSFTITVTTDTTAPVLTNISSSAGSTTSTVSWTTDTLATSKVYYSTTTPVSLNTSPFVTNATLKTSHSLNITGLSASTLYHYIIESTDASANKTNSSEGSFTTSS